MRIDILTLFPEMFQGPLTESILGRAAARGLISLQFHNIRDYARDHHRTTDDYPYGGGPGMVMKPEPIFDAVEAAIASVDRTRTGASSPHIVLTSPQGRVFSQHIAEELSRRDHILFICGHYEGVDERVRRHLAQDEISIGDYVLTGGELAAMVIVDATVRLIPGVLGDLASAQDDSFTASAQGLLQYPHYTRPPEYRGWKAPDVLLGGNHAEVARWRRLESIRRTWRRRPDLLARAGISAAELAEALALPEE